MKLILNISPPKSGTSALFNCLARSAAVAKPSVKEPVFFSRSDGSGLGSVPDALRPHGRYDLGTSWFDELFSGDSEDQCRIDFSTAYFVTEDTPELVRAYDPEARLIFVVRDPVDRFVSHYYHLQRIGASLPPFSDVIGSSDDIARAMLRYCDCVETLKAYRDTFGADRICVLKFDDLQDAPERIEARLRTFLNIPDFEFRPSRTEKNASGRTRSRLLRSILSGPHLKYIARFIPLLDRLGLLRLRRRLVRLNTEAKSNPPLSPEDRRKLEQLLAPQYALYRTL